jgi:hypothetical protein
VACYNVLLMCIDTTYIYAYMNVNVHTHTHTHIHIRPCAQTLNDQDPVETMVEIVPPKMKMGMRVVCM